MHGCALRSLTLSHFRSYKHARLEAHPGPIAVFGPNGSGKTNILEAISYLSPGRGMRRAAVADVSRKPEALGWKVSAELDSLGRMHEVETSVERDAARSVRIDGKAASQLALGRIARIVWLVPAMDRLWIEGAEGRRRFLDRITLSFEPSHGQAVLDYDKAMRERNRLLKDNVRDAHWYAALETTMAEAGQRIRQNRDLAISRLSSAQEGAKTVFPAADLTLSTPETDGGIEPDLARQLAENRTRDMAAGRTLIGPHRDDLVAVYTAKATPARDCSTGEQKALLVSLILSNARALKQDLGAPPILLLDEIAAHLDQDRQAALYDEICALEAQAWMTGTGKELFEALGDRAQYLKIEEVDGQSHLRDVE